LEDEMNIRHATINDKETILNLVQRLAQYEKIKPQNIQLTLGAVDNLRLTH
jgi:hypothetical protein